MKHLVTRLAIFLLLATVLLGAGCEIFTPPTQGEYSDIPSFKSPVLKFSHEPGRYDLDNLPELEIITSLQDAIIYYTLDGSRPDPDNIMTDSAWEQAPRETRARTFRYNGPVSLAKHIDRPNDIARIPTNNMSDSNTRRWIEPEPDIPKAVSVRALAFAGKYRSREHIGTYSVYQHDLPVISILTDRANLFDYYRGIYVAGVNADPDRGEEAQYGNYRMRGSEWERPAHIELFENDSEHTRSLSQHIGIRIHGGYSRRLAQKTLRLYARSDYGPSRMHYPFFPDDKPEVDIFNRLLLRHSGQDNNRSFIRDAVMHGLVAHLSLDTQGYRPSVVYINGEYWGLHNIRDRQDEYYLATHYPVDAEQVTVLNRNATLEHGSKTVRNTYYDMVKAVGKSLDTAEKINQHMDLENYFDYVTMQWYAANTDWPHNNIRFWRVNQPLHTTGHLDGRWRWMVYDVDRSFGYVTTYKTNMVEWTMGMPDEIYLRWSRDLIHNLMDIPEVRRAFFQRAAAHMAITYDPNRVKQRIDQTADVIRSEIPNQYSRWSAPHPNYWRGQLSTMRTFAERRPEYVLQHIYEHFDDTSGTAELSFSNLPNSSSLTLENLPINTTSLTANMFTGIPLNIRSNPTDSGQTALNLLSLDISGDYTLLAHTADHIKIVLNGSVTIQP